MSSFPHPPEFPKANSVRLRQIRQGSRSEREYVSEFRQLAGVVQDWPEQVKIHFFREGLHLEVAQWAMKPDSPVVPVSGAVKAGMTMGPGKKSPFKKSSGLQVVSRKASLASEEAGGPESSEESAGSDSDLA
uniref:Uncharacterized protein n=1 Tax=Sphaerodactylus townsendi TaxID=933632 RepID=A0ACB8EC95_9SAUR